MNPSALGPSPQAAYIHPLQYNNTTTTTTNAVHGCARADATRYPRHLSIVYPAHSIVPSNACLGSDGRPVSFGAPPAEPVVFSNPWAHDAPRSSLPARSHSGSVSLTCVHPEVPAELRRHPRRVAAPVCAEVPPIANQAHRKVSFVDKIVASATEIVKAIWPRSWTVETGSALPLRTFIQETLRRSRTSFSTLQVALYYLILIRPVVIAQRDSAKERTLGCGRRMFLSALILASKYLQDRNYSARAWAKISGLSVTEINQNEIAFLIAIDWRLYVAQDIFEQWTRIVGTHAPSTLPPSATAVSHAYFVEHARWRKIILGITPQLDNLELLLEVDDSTWQPVAGPISPPQTPEPNVCMPLAASGAAGRGSAMAMAVAQHNTAMRSGSARSPTALGVSVTPPPDLARRSSVASYAPSTRSVASSPESMVSDVSEGSRSSRSSSISSSSSLPGAQPNLSVQARIRQAMQCGEKATMERFSETAIMSSPESFVSSAPYSYGTDAAARALAELQRNRHDYLMPVPKPSLKRYRRMSGEDAVESGFACPKFVGPSYRKRARVDTAVESAAFVQLTPAVAAAPQGPGMWAGIL